MSSGPGRAIGLKRIIALQSRNGNTSGSKNGNGNTTNSQDRLWTASRSIEGFESSTGLRGLQQNHGPPLPHISTSPLGSNQRRETSNNHNTRQRMNCQRQGRGPTSGSKLQKEVKKERSRINSRNLAKMRFSHTSGRTPIFSRFKEMEEKSEIELFKKTRVSKKRDGEFVNAHAQSIYDEMVELKRQSLDKDGEPLSEAEIVKSKLGERSGYIKGMGHGLHVLRGSCSKVVAGINLKEKLTEFRECERKDS